MLTNIDIDEDLIAKAMEVSGAKTKREVVDRALRDLVARSKRTRFSDMWGTGGSEAFWPGYDPKLVPRDPPGAYRVEEGVATYKVAPTPAPTGKPRKK